MIRNYYNDELSDDKISEIIQEDFKSDRNQIEMRKRYPQKVEKKDSGWILCRGVDREERRKQYNENCWYR